MRNTKLELNLVTKAMLLSSMMLTSVNVIAQDDEQSKKQQIKEEGIERITISSRKKVESVQDVGIAVTSLNGEDLENLGINKTEDLVKVVPSLDIKQANGQGNVNVTLRGVGLNDYSSTTSPTVGVYVDEVFLGYTGMLSFGMFDVERVEVLKGPQGTLYGRNTTGGAVTFATAKPLNDEANGYINVSLEDYETTEIRGAISVGLTDELSVRFAGIHRDQGESFYTNHLVADAANFDFTPTGETENFGSSTLDAYRFSVLYESGDVEVYANIHAGKQEFPVILIEHFGGFDSNFNPCYTGSESLSNANGCTDFVGYADNESTGNYGGHYQDFPKNEVDTLGGVLKVDIELENATFSSVTGYESYERNSIDDVSANPIPEYLELYMSDDIEEFSQEFRLVGEADKLEYIVGVFYSKDEIVGDYHAEAELLIGGLFADAFGDPSLADAAFDLDNDIKQETTTYAVFSHFEYAIEDNLSAILGLRFTKEEKTFSSMTWATPKNDFAVGVTEFVMGPGMPGILLSDSGLNFDANGDIVDTPANNEYEVENFSGLVGVEWKVEDDVLLYGTISNGFKSGGWFGSFAFDFPEVEQYKKEKLIAYEFGVKSRLADGDIQFNASAFYYDYSDFQALVETTLAFKLANVDSAELMGIEAEFWYTGIENFTFNAAIGLLDTEISDPTGLYDGNEMANAADVTFNVLGVYDIELESGAIVSLQADAKYSDDMFKSAANSPYAFSESFLITNARVTYANAEGDWSVSAYVKNISDESYITQAFEQANDFGANQAFFSEPRTFGVSVKYNFD